MFEFLWYVLGALSRLTISENGDFGSHEGETAANAAYSHKPKMKSLNIPYYFQGENEDSIELQIKSLVYVFHRYKIGYLKPFLKPVSEDDFESNDQYDFGYFDEESNQFISLDFDYHDTSLTALTIPTGKVLMNSKLDEIYNLKHFKKQLLNDPYRILVDYSKNKFRSLLILSAAPINGSTPSLSTNFQFHILDCNAHLDRYIEILVYKSGIYCEHKINNKIKIQLLTKIYNKQKSATEQFTLDERARIIKLYLQKLALHIQVQRIFKANLKSKERILKNKFKNESSIQFYKNLTLKNKKSKLLLLPEIEMDMDSGSSKNNEISIVENDLVIDSDCHYYSDTTESQASTSTTSTVNFSKIFSQEEKYICFEQSKMAVKLRIEKERSLLMY